MRSILTILTGIMLVCSAVAENVTALRPAINDAAAQHGVDPVLMEAIIRHESANATSSAARRKNNLAGIMGKKGQRKYQSKEECVQDLAQLLAKYRAKGRTTVPQIARVYCKSTSTWIRHVNGYMSQIRSGKFGELEQKDSDE
ncbi:MAG: glucosaminidase domain-containing protein [Akkermansia sp.]|nr:glucosaminidase domain-containing protein [Akkermansia sp.]MBR5876332.1 glucosaminidase domain-containing protein [Akkermansia sp.]